MSDSILDRVMSAKHAEEAARFVPHEILQKLVEPLTSREREVLTRRFGLSGKEQETLEKIGESYEVTRERIRQIERFAIQRIKDATSFVECVSVVEHVVVRELEEAGGVLDTAELLSRLVAPRDRQEESHAILHFILFEVISDRFQKIEGDPRIRDGWAVRAFDVAEAHVIIERLEKILEEKGVPSLVDDVVKAHRALGGDTMNVTDEKIDAYLRIAKNIHSNPFGEFGLKTWSTIVPKRMTDKIYLVMKHYGKPLHFTDIATKVNEAKFDLKVAHAPTVHNELIMDKRYVLVGRGMYGLQELGFKPGIVADVIEYVLRDAGEPLRRDAIVDRVLQQRVVGKATIHLALMNKERFLRLPDGRYRLNEKVVSSSPEQAVSVPV